MEYMYELKEKLCRELDEIARKPELSAGDLETVHKLTDTIKNIDKISMLEDDGHSHGGDWMVGGSGTYNRGSSYARRRDSMGRYSREGERNGSRYSRDGGKDRMINQLEGMMNSASERERDAIRRCIEQIEAM